MESRIKNTHPPAKSVPLLVLTGTPRRGMAAAFSAHVARVRRSSSLASRGSESLQKAKGRRAPPTGRSIPLNGGQFDTVLVLRTYAPWGVHRTCGEPDEIKKKYPPEKYYSYRSLSCAPARPAVHEK